ncbi:MAG: serine hydrolase [Chitinophagia bacterium]|nr:serine hydrolase [Chitinophagia bacterium]
MKRLLILLLFGMSANNIHAQLKEQRKQQLIQEIQLLFASEEGVFAMAFKDLGTGDTIYWNEKELFHAASTMKTPVMIEVFRQAALGSFTLQDTMVVRKEFQSIVDGSWYTLLAGDDSDDDVYAKMGTPQTIQYLLERMITRSSNVATNLLMTKVKGERITATMRQLGAPDILVRRGVEDNKAYQQGLNNVTSAYDLQVIFEQLARGKAVNPDASSAMVDILKQQYYNDLIPALLPKNVQVAHKTGWITGVHHDGGIIYLPDGRKYVLVLLSKNCKQEAAAVQLLATTSSKIYNYFID